MPHLTVPPDQVSKLILVRCIRVEPPTVTIISRHRCAKFYHVITSPSLSLSFTVHGPGNNAGGTSGARGARRYPQDGTGVCYSHFA